MRHQAFYCASALVSSLVITAPVFAQAASNLRNSPIDNGQEADLKKQQGQATADSADGQQHSGGDILVTGSRIPRPETSGTLPGVQVDGAQIEARGFTNALEALNDIPLVGPGATFNGPNGGQSASLGVAFVDLLDLGTQRTLTLVNGRRFVSGNSATLFVDGNATGSQVDVNAIPSSLIQRVDVLTVGGAAAYGSDAIAGVVNYILKDDYEGSEMRALSGISDRGDAGKRQFNILAGRNFADGHGNITLSGEYTHLDGLQADSRDFRLARVATLPNFASGGARNPAFSPSGTIVDVQGVNNGAFLRTSDDLISANAYSQGIVSQVISYTGTILNTLSSPGTYYTPDAQGFISLRNGVGAPSLSNFNTSVQLVSGTPGATLISGNGLNGSPTALANLPITTFAPTALPTGVTASQVFTLFGVAPPTGATAAQLSTLAINVLQANRPTAREFFAANPDVNINSFIGTFIPGVPRVANTDTTLVNVRSNSNGGTVKVPLNQVLPFVSVPLEFTDDGRVRAYTAASGVTPLTQATLAQSVGSNGGYSRIIENSALRTQQDRYIANLNGKYNITDDITLFTENLFAWVRNVLLKNSASSNSITTTTENAALVLNVDNPYLNASDRAALNAVGINASTRGGSFVVSRQNQDIFGDNPFTNTSETYRLVGGVRSKFRLAGHDWTSEVSATYGHVTEKTQTTQISDVEYQLALDAVDKGLVTTGVASGNIVCRAQLFPSQYLGRTPTGTSVNLTRQPGADGIPTEVLVLPKITQEQIDACSPLNPFGYNQMSNASKAYVRQDNVFKNVSAQTSLQATMTGAFFDLPAGPLGLSATGEYRKESLSFASDLLNQLGRGRSAPAASTSGFTKTYEIGGEARAPIFGPGLLPGLGSLEFTPALRVSQQNGQADTYRTLAGQIVTPRANGKVETIYSLAGTWRPTRDIVFRGNYTRSVRNPSIVELFLGGQPTFSTPTEFCSSANIDQGLQKANRRKNCTTAVISSGVLFNGVPVTTAAQATQFLASFVPQNQSLQGSFSGAPSLQPEKGKSWTVGGVLTPRFLPGFSFSADYIHLDLSNIINATSLVQAVQFCYDSPTYPDTSRQTGANTCNGFSRGTDFQIKNGFASGFINLAATQVRALNISARYSFRLPFNAGQVSLNANAYHLINYRDSAAGDFSDAQESAGTFNRPTWKVQGSGRLERGAFYTQLTWNWRNSTRLFSSGQPATIEFAPLLVYPSASLFDVVVGADLNERFRVQFNVQNLTDVNYDGTLGFYNSGYIDQIGRRFQVATFLKF